MFCPVCISEVSSATTLVCDHVVCNDCVKGMKRSRRRMKCPTCRGKWRLKNDRVSHGRESRRQVISRARAEAISVDDSSDDDSSYDGLEITVTIEEEEAISSSVMGLIQQTLQRFHADFEARQLERALRASRGETGRAIALVYELYDDDIEFSEFV